jgi:hypothetical protein
LKRTTLLATLFAVAALAGCSDVKGGTPTTGNTQPPATETSDTGSTRAPTTELNIDKVKDKPCDVLTAAQVTALGNVDVPRQRKAALGPSCVWDGKEALDDSTYEIWVGTEQSFENQLNTSRSAAVFSEKTIEGVRTFSRDSADGIRLCLTVIEAGKTGTVGVSMNLAKNKAATQKACTETEKLAATVIGNLKG